MPSQRIGPTKAEKQAKKAARQKLRDISKDQAKRAIYIDFEGNKKVQPTFLGYEVDGQHTVLLIEDAFEILERPSRGFEHSEREFVGSMNAALSHLCERSIQEDRLIISFSGYEREMFLQYAANDEFIPVFKERYRDGKALIDHRMRNDQARLKRGHRNLNNYCKLLGHQPPRPPSRGVSRAISDLRSRLRATNQWRKLADRWKKLSAEVIAYNRSDCRRLKDVTLSTLFLPENA